MHRLMCLLCAEHMRCGSGGEGRGGKYSLSRHDTCTGSCAFYVLNTCGVGQEARGVEVTSRIFAGSPHVAHLRQYPSEYEAELDRFMGAVQQAAPAA